MLPEWEIGFDNFLNWLAYSGEAFSEFYNEHWGSYYNMCRPCDINYTAVLQTETLSNEVNQLVNEWHIPDSVGKFRGAYPSSSSAKVREEYYDNLRKAYSDIPRRL